MTFTVPVEAGIPEGQVMLGRWMTFGTASSEHTIESCRLLEADEGDLASSGQMVTMALIHTEKHAIMHTMDIVGRMKLSPCHL